MVVVMETMKKMVLVMQKQLLTPGIIRNSARIRIISSLVALVEVILVYFILVPSATHLERIVGCP